MALNVLHFRGSRLELRSILGMVPQIIAGHAADPAGIVRGLQLRIGVQALSLIKIAFITKARGGTDEAGDSWPPLSPKTVAYHRRHPGLAEARAKAKAEGRPGRPLLTKQENKRWKALYTRALRGLAPNPLKPPGREEKAHAASYAWRVLKSEGGKTIFGEYADAEVETLRDTGMLLDSLSPGIDGPSGHPNQVFTVNYGEVIVGTNRKGAARHHNGIGVPQRRLWPEWARWPKEWRFDLLDQLQSGTVSVIRALLGG